MKFNIALYLFVLIAISGSTLCAQATDPSISIFNEKNALVAFETDYNSKQNISEIEKHIALQK